MCAPSDSYFTESLGALILSEPKANDPAVSYIQKKRIDWEHSRQD